MHPSPISNDQIPAGHQRRVIGPPAGHDIDSDIRPVEAAITVDPVSMIPVFRMRIVLDPGDLERFTAGEPVWLAMWGGVIPWDLAFEDES